MGAIHPWTARIGSLIIGVGRRVFDSRFYAIVYQDISEVAISHVHPDKSSIKSARLGMTRELVEFLENSLPELISNVIGLVGVMVIISTLNLQVFVGSLVVSLVVGAVYSISSRKRSA